MIEIKGKYNSAKIFADILDESSISQITQLCNQEFTAGSSIRMMPDVHAGASCTIGTTMTITDKIIPNLVGVDIGCGMETAKLKEKRIDLTKLDKLIYNAIPSGFSIRKKPHRFSKEIDLSALRCYKAVDTRRGDLSIGTLGGGNHFIEAGRAEDEAIYLVVHSGSRHLGLEVAKYYQEQAYHQCNGTDNESINAVIAQLKAQGREKEIQKAIKAIRNTKRTTIPKALCYARGRLFEDYIHDMCLMQQYAALNRRAIIDELIRGMGLHVAEQFSTIHNYIDTGSMILRKGAVSALNGQKLLIPINMRDGSLVCVGKGNADWNFSAPHGAGRLMSRSAARQSFTLTQFKAQMEGIYSTSISRDTIDECPMAYKPLANIISNIGPTAEIVNIIRPIYNFKSGGDDA